MAATTSQTSNVAKVEVIISLPDLVRSVMAMTETRDESLTRLIYCPESGAESF